MYLFVPLTFNRNKYLLSIWGLFKETCQSIRRWEKEEDVAKQKKYRRKWGIERNSPNMIFKKSKLNQVSSFPGNKIDWRKNTVFFLSLFGFDHFPLLLSIDVLFFWILFRRRETLAEADHEKKKKGKKDRLLLLRFSRIFFSRPRQRNPRHWRWWTGILPSKSESIIGSCGHTCARGLSGVGGVRSPLL